MDVSTPNTLHRERGDKKTGQQEPDTKTGQQRNFAGQSDH